MKPEITPPRPNECCAYAQHGVVKRAALLFDRIYYSWGSDDIPSALLFAVPDAHHHMEAVTDEFVERFREKSASGRMYTAEEVSDLLTELDARLFVDSFRRCGYVVTPVYGRQMQFFVDYPKGPMVAYQAALQNLPDVIEEQVSWDQIVEFRKDEQALLKYRRLRCWLEACVKAESITHAEDILCKRIEDYEWALRKHDLKTATGAVSSIVDWKGITALASGAGVAGLFGGPVWSAIAGGLILGAKVSVWLAERMIDREDVARGEGAEIAVICDAKRSLIKRKDT